MVYEGLDLQTNCHVALKVMSVKDGKATVPIKGVRREIQNAASVQHENVVKLVDFVVDDKTIVIVWELIDGHDLLDTLNEQGGRLEEPLAAFYFAQLLRGVNFMHNTCNLTHRDLKPENCMIEKSTNMLKIIDFGLSKHQQSAVTLAVGTPDYMAPELLGGAVGAGFPALHERRVGQYDARACDVWAMGVLLYLLVTGQYPFEDPTQPQNVVATLQNIALGRMRPLSRRISAECKGLIHAMLTQDPKKRITLREIGKHTWLVQYGFGVDVTSEEKQESDPSGSRMEIDGESDIKPTSVPSQEHPSTPPRKPSRAETFSFPKSNGVSGKSTPVTPRMVNVAANGSSMFCTPVYTAPRIQPTPTRRPNDKDSVIQFVEAATAVPADGQNRVSRFGGLCRMWFSPKSSGF